MHRALRCSKRQGMAPVPPTVHNRIEGTHKEQNGHLVKPCGTLVRSTDSEPFGLTLTPSLPAYQLQGPGEVLETL